MSARRTPSVSYYDVLGVDRDASPETIKKAWREATDKFEPGSGSGQFRLFSDAADTLLDPTRREAYDAELDGEGGDGDVVPTTVAAAPAASTEAASPWTTVDDPDASEESTEPAVAAEQKQKAPRSRPSRSWVLLTTGLAVLVVAVAVLAGIAWSKQHKAAESQDAGEEASAAAERSLGPVLSYDYRQLKADRARALPFLSDKYRKEYTSTFDQLIEQSGTGDPGPAAKTQAVVKASVQNVGVAAADPDRVRLVVFLNQTTTKAGGDPSYSLNRLVVTMTHAGNSWLVDNIVSY
ncbi:J domain-containing protein [Marmoricola endophyticus]|nr:DnaJ domain-containing protein [Marmoricola endophyticus]